MPHRLALALALCSLVVAGAASIVPAQTAPQYVWKAGTVVDDSMRDAGHYVEGQVGKEFMTRLRAAVQAASK